MEVFFKMIYSIIYYYSCVEIWAQKKMNDWKENYFVKKINEFFTVYPIYQFLFVENGEQTIVYKNKDLELKVLRLLEPETYDFIIRNDYANKNHKIIYKRVQDIKRDYEVSNVSFLSFLVRHVSDVEIQLDTKNYTYMIVGNCIDKKLIYYLLKNMEIDVGEFEEFVYSIQILTSDVNFLHLTHKDTIVIKKNHIELV